VRIALIEDDADLAFTVRLNLQREGYTVAHYANGAEGLGAVQLGGFDFVILDLNLPDVDGLTICRELRRDGTTHDIPILMLTARGSERDRVSGLELGADDYLVKPFSVRELIARVAAVLRRAGGGVGEGPDVYEDAVLRVDARAFRVWANGEEVRLPKKEFELLWALVKSRGSVISRERLLNEIWGMVEDVETRTIDVHVRNLRRKLGAERIATVVGFGYRYDPPDSGSS
jgi:two-component system phosphate regulon response regulator PhoB/two-component system alkaline phosphatase synthesis response regulator PhoP